MERINLKEYREMVNEIIEYKNLNGKMPDFVMINGYKIPKRDYIDMIEHVNKFVLEMRRHPRTVDIPSEN